MSDRPGPGATRPRAAMSVDLGPEDSVDGFPQPGRRRDLDRRGVGAPARGGRRRGHAARRRPRRLRPDEPAPGGLAAVAGARRRLEHSSARSGLAGPRRADGSDGEWPGDEAGSEPGAAPTDRVIPAGRAAGRHGAPRREERAATPSGPAVVARTSQATVRRGCGAPQPLVARGTAPLGRCAAPWARRVGRRPRRAVTPGACGRRSRSARRPASHASRARGSARRDTRAPLTPGARAWSGCTGPRRVR